VHQLKLVQGLSCLVLPRDAYITLLKLKGNRLCLTNLLNYCMLRCAVA